MRMSRQEKARRVRDEENGQQGERGDRLLAKRATPRVGENVFEGLR